MASHNNHLGVPAYLALDQLTPNISRTQSNLIFYHVHQGRLHVYKHRSHGANIVLRVLTGITGSLIVSALTTTLVRDLWSEPNPLWLAIPGTAFFVLLGLGIITGVVGIISASDFSNRDTDIENRVNPLFETGMSNIAIGSLLWHDRVRDLFKRMGEQENNREMLRIVRRPALFDAVADHVTGHSEPDSLTADQIRKTIDLCGLITRTLPDNMLYGLDHVCLDPLAAAQIMNATEITRDNDNARNRESYRMGLRRIAEQGREQLETEKRHEHELANPDMSELIAGELNEIHDRLELEHAQRIRDI